VDAVLERRPHLPLPPRLAWAPMRSMVACTAAVPSTIRTPRRRGGRRFTALYQPTPPALAVVAAGMGAGPVALALGGWSAGSQVRLSRRGLWAEYSDRATGFHGRLDPSRFDRPIVRRHVRRVGRSSTGASAGTDISGRALPRDVDVGAAVCEQCYRMGWCWRAAGWSLLGRRAARRRRGDAAAGRVARLVRGPDCLAGSL
jgi:hypothetical protein